jgi:hypothetical protein
VYREFLDVCNIFSAEGGVTFRKNTLDDMLTAIRNSDYSAGILRKSGKYYINNNILTLMSPELRELVAGLGKEKISKLDVVLTESEYAPKGKNYKQIKNTTGSGGSDKDDSKDIVAKIATMISRLPVVSELGECTVEDIIKQIPDDVFYGATQCDKKILELLVKEKLIDTYTINLHLV